MLDVWAIGTGIFSLVLLTILVHSIVIKDCMKNDLKQETLKQRLKYVLFIGGASTNPFDERIVLSEFNCSSRYAGLIQLG